MYRITGAIDLTKRGAPEGTHNNNRSMISLEGKGSNGLSITDKKEVSGNNLLTENKGNMQPSDSVRGPAEGRT